MSAAGAERVAYGAPSWLVPTPVRDWMRTPVLTVPVDTLVREAARLMRHAGVRHLPVVDVDGALTGIVTDRDLRQVVLDPSVQERLGEAGDALAGLTVRDVMTWGVFTVRPETDLREAARVMHGHRIGALPVVEGRRVVGIVTERDLVRALQELLHAHVATVRPTDRGPSGPWEYGFPELQDSDAWRDEATGS
jgi:acetoin utilization protein AcuB